ncbi:MAG: HNH endonuclease [Clostridia bacterium]|nr:HNH endonuclease [Clostridia bacterium]
MKYSDVFKMPKTTKIMARTSSITNSFVNGIIPCIPPTEEEIKNNLHILGMEKENIKCCYCGDICTEWDHFRPLVKDKQPTGYISEINNLVPACGKCNQSKGNKYWKDWILSDALLSPKTRNIPDLETKIEKLENFEKLTNPIKLDFERLVGSELWKKHWENCNKLHDQMKDCQTISDQIKELINDSLKNKNQNFSNQIRPNKSNSTKTNLIYSSNSHSNEYIKDLQNKKVGIIVQNDFKQLLESNILPDFIIDQLQDYKYCKNIFDINFTVLLKIKNESNISHQRKDHLGRDRYYSTPITIKNEQYFLSSQWYDRNKYKLINFIANHATSK